MNENKKIVIQIGVDRASGLKRAARVGVAQPVPFWDGSGTIPAGEALSQGRLFVDSEGRLLAAPGEMQRHESGARGFFCLPTRVIYEARPVSWVGSSADWEWEIPPARRAPLFAPSVLAALPAAGLTDLPAWIIVAGVVGVVLLAALIILALRSGQGVNVLYVDPEDYGRSTVGDMATVWGVSEDEAYARIRSGGWSFSTYSRTYGEEMFAVPEELKDEVDRARFDGRIIGN